VGTPSKPAPIIAGLTTASLASHVAGNQGGSGKFTSQAGHGINRSTSVAGNLESRRQTLAEMVSQIRKYDPYPCILGIPVMPALFATSKTYIFICFILIGSRIFVACMRTLSS